MLPNFLILGAPKCGTTTLHEVLRSRADIFLPPSKDPLFFELDDEYKCGPRFYWEYYFHEWQGEAVVGEARPTKLFLPYVPERIKTVLPEVKLIAMLRNPADRVFSHWWMRSCNGKETLGLSEALRLNTEALSNGRTFEGERGRARWKEHFASSRFMAPVYLEMGHYAEQLVRYLEIFPHSQIKILYFDDLRDRPTELFQDVLHFLGADATLPLKERLVHNAALPNFLLPLMKLDRGLGLSNLIPITAKASLKSTLSRWGQRPQLDREMRCWLADYYLPHNQALSLLTGRDLSHWNVI